jgi:hypothetical protein
MRGVVHLLGLVVLVLAVAPAAASARPPERTHFSFSGSFTVSGLCAFAVTETNVVGEVDQTTHFAQDGSVTEILQHFVEVDSFSANGVTLLGQQYQANAMQYFDHGVLTKNVAQGVVEKVPLPGRGLFLAAGRVDAFTGFTLVPDHGAFHGLDEFCAVLAG